MKDHEFAHLVVRASAGLGLFVASFFAFVIITADCITLEAALGTYDAQAATVFMASTSMPGMPDTMPPHPPMPTATSSFDTDHGRPPRGEGHDDASSTPHMPPGLASTTKAYLHVVSNVCPVLSRDLQKGTYDQGSGQGDVSSLQKFISNYYHVDQSQIVTGYFGSTTKGYVQQFQNEHGLPNTGYMGPMTRQLIARICASASSTPGSNSLGTTTTISSGSGTITTPQDIAFSATPMSGAAPLTVIFSAVSSQNLSGAEIGFGDRQSGQLEESFCSGGACTYTIQHVYNTAGIYTAAVTNGIKLFAITLTVASSTQ